MIEWAVHLRRRFWRSDDRSRAAALILIYHRIADLPGDPFGLAVSPRHFREHLDVLRDRAHPIPLPELGAAIRRGRVPPHAVAVTFDDGYADNLHVAKPLLEDAGIPATVFIASGYIGGDRGFWWDELEDLLLRPGTLPRQVSLKIGRDRYRNDLGAAASYREEDFLRHRFWRYGDVPVPSPRHHLYQWLYPRLRRLPHDSQSRELEALRAWSGSDMTVNSSDLAMDEEELARLGASPNIEIGAHTHHHALLPALKADEQRREISAGKAWLEERLGRPVANFSYPYGMFSRKTASIVRDVGFDGACSIHPSAVRGGAPPYSLPRVLAKDEDGEQFARRLHAWFAT